MSEVFFFPVSLLIVSLSRTEEGPCSDTVPKLSFRLSLYKGRLFCFFKESSSQRERCCCRFSGI